MSQLTQAEQYLLDQIRAGSGEAWSQFVDRYQGRLIAFAKRKLRGGADAEDVVQETFLSFVKSLHAFQERSTLETYLFAILRRKIINWTRGKNASICLLQDVMGGNEEHGEAAARLESTDPTASSYARRGEAIQIAQDALVGALHEMIEALKASLNFRDLKIVEMLFYCRLRNKDIARIADVRENHVAVTKHRCLKQIHDRVQADLTGRYGGAAVARDAQLPAEHAELMLIEAWQSQRLSCLKRSTIGAHLLGTLDTEWDDYVTFHLERLGCSFCRANLEDLREQTRDDSTRQIAERIMQSTVGFLPHA